MGALAHTATVDILVMVSHGTLEDRMSQRKASRMSGNPLKLSDSLGSSFLSNSYSALCTVIGIGCEFADSVCAFRRSNIKMTVLNVATSRQQH